MQHHLPIWLGSILLFLLKIWHLLVWLIMSRSVDQGWKSVNDMSSFNIALVKKKKQKTVVALPTCEAFADGYRLFCVLRVPCRQVDSVPGGTRVWAEALWKCMWTEWFTFAVFCCIQSLIFTEAVRLDKMINISAVQNQLDTISSLVSSRELPKEVRVCLNSCFF